jgi:hypothetical protein
MASYCMSLVSTVLCGKYFFPSYLSSTGPDPDSAATLRYLLSRCLSACDPQSRIRDTVSISGFSSLPFPFQPQSQFHCSHSCVVVSKFNRYTHPLPPRTPSYLTYIYVLHPLTSPVSFRSRLPLASPCIFCFFTQQAFGDPNPGSVHLCMTLLVD